MSARGSAAFPFTMFDVLLIDGLNPMNILKPFVQTFPKRVVLGKDQQVSLNHIHRLTVASCCYSVIFTPE